MKLWSSTIAAPADRITPPGCSSSRRRLGAPILALAATLLFLLHASSARAQNPPDFHTDPRFRAELEAAHSPGQIAATAITHWQNANRIAAGQCAECFERIATLSFRSGQWEQAAEAAVGFETLSTTPVDKGYAELMRGSALLRVNDDKPSLLDLDTADQSFKAAFAHDASLRTAVYLDGRALAALHRDREARAAFTQYLQLAPPTDPYRARAQGYLDNLKLARATMASPFAVTTLDGRHITLDDLHGRVVLLDFWATWCVPCQQLLPRLQRLATQLQGQPFTLISISWDEDADAWKQYIAANHMSWPQVLDTGHTLSAAYGVDALPHYFTIDGDGALQSEVIGLGEDDLETRIAALLAKRKNGNASVSKESPEAIN